MRITIKTASKFITSIITVFIACISNGYAQPEFTWKRLASGGGGMNTGLIIHPAVPDLVYGRHDVSGLYRWNSSNQEWIQLLDWMDMDWNKVRGCDGFAVDTAAGSNTTRQDTIYAALGEVAQEGVPWLQTALGTGIWRSTNRGDTWVKIWDGVITTAEGVEIMSYASNSELRMHGEPLAVDPSNPDILYAGTRNAGLYRSSNCRASSPTFSKISNAPQGLITSKSKSTGIRNVLIDSRQGTVGSGSNLRSKVVYLGVPEGPDKGVYRSTDGGNNFQLISTNDANKNNMEMALGPNNSIIVSGGAGAGLRKYNGSWSTLPQTASISGQFLGMDTDPNNRSRIVAEAAQELWYSENGGNTWHREFNWQHDMDTYREDWNSNKIPTAKTLRFDPYSPNRVLHGNGWGVDEFVNISVIKTANPVVVRPWHRGLATTVSMDICAPASGNLLYNPAADMGGFMHASDLTAPSLQTLTEYLFGDEGPSARSSILSDVEVAPSNARYVAISRSTDIGFTSAKTKIYLSSDFGDTWDEFNLPPVSVMPGHGSTAIGNGKMCISSSDRNRMIFVGSNRYPYYCTNAFSGNQPNWQQSTGTDWFPVSVLPWFPDTFRLAADPNNGMTFYYTYLDPGGNDIKLFRSTDGGASWQVPSGQSGLGERVETLYMDTCKNAAGNTEVWIAGMRKGNASKPGIPLKRSTNGGVTFTLVNPDIVGVYGFAFGKAAPGANVPALFVAGHVRINGVEEEGFFISDDLGQSFRQMTEGGKPIADGYDLELMEGDPNVYGRVFFSCHGKGVVYSESSAGGSGGGGQSVIHEAEDLSFTSSGAWASVQSNSSASGGAHVKLGGDSVGDVVTFTIDVPSGNYDVIVSGVQKNNQGICKLLIDGSRLGDNWDQRQGGGVIERNFGNISLSGPTSFAFEVTGTSGSDYKLSIDKIRLEALGGPPAPTAERFEAEDLSYTATTSGWVSEPTHSSASEGVHVKLGANAIGDSIAFSLNIPAAGDYQIDVDGIQKNNQGICKLIVGASQQGGNWDQRVGGGVITKSFGIRNLPQGVINFTFEVIGTSGADYKLSIDKIDLTPQ